MFGVDWGSGHRSQWDGSLLMVLVGMVWEDEDGVAGFGMVVDVVLFVSMQKPAAKA